MPLAVPARRSNLNRIRHNFIDSVDPALTTPELPLLRPRARAAVANTKQPSRNRSWEPFVWLASVLLAAASGFYQPWKSLSSESVTTTNQTSNTTRTVTIDRPAPAATASVVLPATVRPWQTTTLNARVSGYLSAWHRDLGAPVKAGDLLAEIETPELDQEVAQSEALFRESVAAVAQARAERAEAQADLKVAEAQLIRTQAETELARTQLVRREKLLTNRAVSQEEHETSLMQVAARTADVTAAESEIVRRRTNLETRAAIIEVREATAKSRRSNVDRLKELQVFKRIVAPFDGVVTRRAAEIGMLVTAGKESLFIIEDLSRVRVQVNVPQTYAVQTSPGVEAAVSVPESALPAVKGTITRIAESVESTSRTMLAEIELENASHRFQSGSYVQVTLTTAQDHSQWTIPTNTLQMRVEGPHVAVVDDQNQIEIRRVRLGRDLGARVVVADGIRGDERLVVHPSDDLVSGLRIQIRGAEPAREIARR